MTALGAPQLGAGYGRPAAPATNPTYTARIRQKAATLPRPRSSVAGRLLRGISLLLALAALVSLAAIGSLQVLQSSRTAEAGYELRSLQAERAQLGARMRLLEANIAHLADLNAVHADATGRLGMVPAERSVTVAVAVPAPSVIPMPERYVQQVAPLPTDPVPWWERLLGSVTGIY